MPQASCTRPRPRLLAKAVTLTLTSLLVASCSGGTRPELEAGSPTATPSVDATPQTTATPAPETTLTGEPSETPTATDGAAPTPTSAPGAPRPSATPAPVSGPAAFTSSSKLTTAGLDEVFFGDTVEQAADRLGSAWVGLPQAGSEPECYTLQAAGEPRGVVFTVWSGHIERVDIGTDLITTRSGAGIGSTPAELAALFGTKLVTTPVDGGDEIAFVPESEADKEFRIIWTTDGTAVVAMRAGRIPVVTPPTPCS